MSVKNYNKLDISKDLSKKKGFSLLYSKKLIDESCACSDSWVREAMQYQSYVYIFFSITSFLVLLAKLLIGDDYRELIKIQKVLTNKK